jgi:hypothetical protein
MGQGTTPDGRRYNFDAGQAAAQLEQRGGFTMQRSTGSQPAHGWMVSDFGAEHVVPGHASAREIDAYRQSHPNPTPTKRYVGGWFDEGKTYLDSSRNVRSGAKAQKLGRKDAQRAVYNIDRDKVVRVHHGKRIDARGTLFAGHPEAAQSLRLGNSDAVRQQTEAKLNRPKPLKSPKEPSNPNLQQALF